MSSIIKFNVGGTDYPLVTPQYGYLTTISLALIHQRVMPRGWSIWDNGSDKDSRTCKAVWLLNYTDTNTLRNFFSDSNKARNSSFYLRLNRNSGFFPFGPDHGDVGEFKCKLIDMIPGPVLEEPWQYFETTLIFKEETNPSYSLPAQVPEGDLQIGTIEDLRYPPGFPKSTKDFGFSARETYSGVVYMIDKTSDADFLSTTLPMFCNQSKSAALINHMVNVVRNNNVNITAQSNNFIFGHAGLGYGIYTSQFLNSQISIKHERFDGFSFDLSFYMSQRSEPA